MVSSLFQDHHPDDGNRGRWQSGPMTVPFDDGAIQIERGDRV
jgi:hypothetical protein